jgi:branched-subunit amino acid transport protein
MEVRYEILLIIAGCGLVTLVPRIFPLLFLRRYSFPKWYQEWLSFLPVTIMAGLVADQLMPKDGDWHAAAPNIVASVACLLCAVLSRSLFATVMCGVAVVSLLAYFG